MIKFLFAPNYSITTAAFGAGVTYDIMTGRYIAAVIMFAAAVVIGIAGELALERRA